jgi:predicted TIM-barrel fold metal-dependent hydrolase
MAQPAFFDACALIGRPSSTPAPVIAQPAELLAEYDYYGIGAGLVHHAAALGERPDYANRLLLEEVEGHPALVPQWVLTPDDRTPPPDELIPEMLDLGVCAARICPRTHRFDVCADGCAALLKALQESGLPLFVDIAELDIQSAADLARRHPRLPVVLCGVAWGSDRSLLPALERAPNLHIETHALYGHRIFERIARRFGADRLLFGTGLPDWSASAAIMMPLYEALSSEDRAAVAGGNLRRLLRAVDADRPLPLPRLRPAPPRDDDDPILACLRQGRPLDGEFIFDAHGHIGHEGSMGTAEWCVPLTDADSLVGTMDRLGIDRAIVSPWSGLRSGDPAANDVTLRAIQRHPGRLLGYGCVNPRYPEVMQREVRRVFRGGAMTGYKPYPPQHAVPIRDPRHRPMLEWCDRHRRPVLCHGWLGGPEYVTPEDLDLLAPIYPGALFLSTHVGGSWEFAEALVPVIRKHPNVYADIAYPQTPRGIVEYLAREAGAHRVTYGSDALLIDPASQLGWVAWARIPVEDRRRILGGNLARMLRIGERGQDFSPPR